MELRDRIAELIAVRFQTDQGGFLGNGEDLADAILDIPEIKDALRSQCSSCDGARGPLLCTECVRDFIKAE